MFIGRPFIFECDFCKTKFENWGYGLPKGMKWIASNIALKLPMRHICKICIDKGLHGTEALYKAGESRFKNVPKQSEINDNSKLSD